MLVKQGNVFIYMPFFFNFFRTRLVTTKILGYNQSTSRVTSISENKMNIRIPLCNVRHLNGMFDISLTESFRKKDALSEKNKTKKIQNTWETIVIPKILNAVM